MDLLLVKGKSLSVNLGNSQPICLSTNLCYIYFVNSLSRFSGKAMKK